MASYAAGVNPSLLRWARERAGYSLEAVAQHFKREVAEIQGWETGAGVPTYSQLEMLAYILYKRPVAIFFFPEPPEEPEPSQSFRTLPVSEIKNLLPDTRLAIRQAQAMQIALKELNDGRNPCQRLIFREMAISIHGELADTTRAIRSYLGISLNDQIFWTSYDEALKKWRDAVQDSGIFVFKRSFKQKDVSGFCLFDEEFPVIYLNNSTSTTRQIFSLFHELSHLLLKTNAVTKVTDDYVAALVGEARDIEVYCNRFTAEYLVPSEDFEHQLSLTRTRPPDEVADVLSKHYKVSREVILRKLLDRELIDQTYYEFKVAQWIEEYEVFRQSRKGGGDYYATQATYLGDRFLGLAFTRFHQGKCTPEQLADYLNVKTKSVAGLEQHHLSKASAG